MTDTLGLSLAMGSHCCRSRHKSEQPEDQNIQNDMKEDSFWFRIYTAQNNTKQWKNEGLKEGSHIPFSSVDKKSYWMWERNCKSDEPKWRFRVDAIKDLYIAYEDPEKSDELTMQNGGQNSYFSVKVNQNGTYKFQVPNTEKYIAVKDDKLILSKTATEWSLRSKMEDEFIAFNRKDVVLIKDKATQKKWICDFSVPGSDITVALVNNQPEKAQWRRMFSATNHAWQFQPKRHSNIYVTCNALQSKISLEPSSNNPEKDRLVEGSGSQSVIMKALDAPKYFCTKTVGDDSILTMTSLKKLATHWDFYICGFEITTSDQSCGYKERGTHQEKPESSATLSQESQESK